MHVEIGRYVASIAEEREELLMAMARLALGEHGAVSTSSAANSVVVPCRL